MALGDFAIFQWIYAAILAPILGTAAILIRNRWRRRSSARRRKERIIQHLSGLPLEAKAVLIEFHQNGAHTMRCDPFERAIKVLVNQGVIIPGPGGGTYDAVDRYFSIRPEIWELIEDWVIADAVSLLEVRRLFF